MTRRPMARQVRPRSAGSEWSWVTPRDAAKSGAGGVLLALAVLAFLVLLLTAGQPL